MQMVSQQCMTFNYGENSFEIYLMSDKILVIADNYPD
jgi:hypothetical protein